MYSAPHATAAHIIRVCGCGTYVNQVETCL